MRKYHPLRAFRAMVDEVHQQLSPQFANAFFAAAEFTLVSIRDTRIQQLINWSEISKTNSIYP